MDPISALNTNVNLQTLPISTPAPIPSSKSYTVTTQQQPTSTGDIQITTSINQLRSFSTALSAFISRYDELHNHISLINSSIDSKLPNHLLDGTNPNCSVLLETSCDRTVQNPRERVIDCELRHAIATAPENTKTDALEKVEATADVWKNHEEIEVCENRVEIDSLKKLEVDDKHEEIDVCEVEDPVEIDSLNMQKETVPESSCDETIADVPEAIVSEENPNTMAANGKQSNENVRTPESVEEIDVSVHKKIEEDDHCRNAFETIMLKKLEEIASLMSPDKINSSKTHGEIETVLETSMRTPESFEEADAVVDIPNKVEVTDICKDSEHIDVLQEPEESLPETSCDQKENGTCKKANETEAPKKFVISMLQSLCRGMCTKDMKWFVATHYSEMINHREEIAKSLKLAKDPAKLVLYSIGKFFIQSNKTFCNPQNKESLGRMASVLLLECFVMISGDDGIVIAKRERQYAAEAAVDWKKRMIKESGLRNAEEVDARGLLLLISGFGIEDHAFKTHVIMHLIRASNVKGIAPALRRSVFLVPKISEVIYMMVNNDMEIDAVDIAYIFGLERACLPAKILTTYLQNKIRVFQNAPPHQMLEARKQHLIDLKSVKQCLESHNVDPSTLLPEFKINEKIQNLEKEVNEWKLDSQKRKYLENPIHQEAKRPSVNHQNMPHQHRPDDYYSMNRSNWSTQPSTSYITNHGQAGGFYGSYDQTVHTANNQPHGWRGPYGQHHPTHGQGYGSQPEHRPWEQGQLESFPGFLGRQPPPSDLYSFAKLVEKGSRGSSA